MSVRRRASTPVVHAMDAQKNFRFDTQSGVLHVRGADIIDFPCDPLDPPYPSMHAPIGAPHVAPAAPSGMSNRMAQSLMGPSLLHRECAGMGAMFHPAPIYSLQKVREKIQEALLQLVHPGYNAGADYGNGFEINGDDIMSMQHDGALKKYYEAQNKSTPEITVRMQKLQAIRKDIYDHFQNNWATICSMGGKDLKGEFDRMTTSCEDCVKNIKEFSKEISEARRGLANSRYAGARAMAPARRTRTPANKTRRSLAGSANTFQAKPQSLAGLGPMPHLDAPMHDDVCTCTGGPYSLSDRVDARCASNIEGPLRMQAPVRGFSSHWEDSFLDYP